MPKKKSSRPSASLGSNQRPEPKSASQVKRERIVRIAAITIVLALLLSLLAGAFSVTPSQAADVAENPKSVHILQNDTTPAGSEANSDTDGDGLINNQDSDIDGDGIVNGKDQDIDGDGIQNFDDSDPIDTSVKSGNLPQKPDRPPVMGDKLFSSNSDVWVSLAIGAFAIVSLWILAKIRKRRE